MAARLINKPRVNLEPRSAHGRAVNNKPRAEHEPRSAHGRPLKKNKPRVEHKPRSAHGRAVKKPRVNHEPRSAHGRAVNNWLLASHIVLSLRSWVKCGFEGIFLKEKDLKTNWLCMHCHRGLSSIVDCSTEAWLRRQTGAPDLQVVYIKVAVKWSGHLRL